MAQDFSGNGNTASLKGSFRWSQGLGGALALGGNGYIDCGRTPELNLHEQDFTIMIWIKTPPGFASPDNPQTIDSDLVEIQMATSRDGIHWKRLDRKPYVGLELDGTSLSGSIYMGVGMLRVGNEIYQYYGGSKFTHAVGVTNECGIKPRFLLVPTAWAGRSQGIGAAFLEQATALAQPCDASGRVLHNLLHVFIADGAGRNELGLSVSPSNVDTVEREHVEGAWCRRTTASSGQTKGARRRWSGDGLPPAAVWRRDSGFWQGRICTTEYLPDILLCYN